jgi:hypothetical protein
MADAVAGIGQLQFHWHVSLSPDSIACIPHCVKFASRGSRTDFKRVHSDALLKCDGLSLRKERILTFYYYLKQLLPNRQVDRLSSCPGVQQRLTNLLECIHLKYCKLLTLSEWKRKNVM